MPAEKAVCDEDLANKGPERAHSGEKPMMDGMMDGMGGMMGGMGLIGLVLLIVLVLGIAALIKYLMK